MDVDRPLRARLDEIREAFVASSVPVEDRQILDDHVAELAASDIRFGVRSTGYQLPPAELVDSAGERRELRSLAGEDSLVLNWFRGHW